MKENELKEGIPYKTLYTLEGVPLSSMADLKTFCLLEGTVNVNRDDGGVSGLRRGPTYKLNQ